MKCEICGVERDSGVLGRHVRISHNMATFDYATRFLNHSKERPYCGCGCGKEVGNWLGITHGWPKFIQGHNTSVRCDSVNKRISETLKQKYKSGEIEVWNKDKTKENDERMKKISNSLMGNIISEETKKKISNAVKNLHENSNVYNSNWRNKIADANKGKIKSEEERKQISERQKGTGNSMYGKEITQEWRNNHSKIMKRLYKDGKFKDKIISWKTMGLNFSPSRFEVATSELLKSLNFIPEHRVRIVNGRIGQSYYHIDFAHIETKTAIELDSEIHNNPKVKKTDSEKDRYLQSLGWRIFRFPFLSSKESPEQLASRVLQKVREILNENTINKKKSNHRNFS